MKDKTKITYSKLEADVKHLAKLVKESKGIFTNIYPIPRGGVPVALLLAKELNLKVTDELDDNSLVVDDLIDSGSTIDEYIKNGNTVAALYRKPYSPQASSNLFIVETFGNWVEFPYEETTRDVQENFRRILEYLGEDTTREGLQETPKRYIKFMEEFLTVPEFNFTAFEGEGADEMIIQKDIPFFSLCEHHTAPFFGLATVAYIPGDKIVGLSKLARTVQLYSHRFQNQERITKQVAERLEKELSPKGVAVTLSARHFCMEMRGVKTHDTQTITTKLIGAFKHDEKARAEYMSQINK